MKSKYILLFVALLLVVVLGFGAFKYLAASQPATGFPNGDKITIAVNGTFYGAKDADFYYGVSSANVLAGCFPLTGAKTALNIVTSATWRNVAINLVTSCPKAKKQSSQLVGVTVEEDAYTAPSTISNGTVVFNVPSSS